MNLDREFPYDLGDDLGEIIEVEEYCPGVFYVTAKGEDSPIALEYYVLREDNPIITAEAKAHGERLEYAPDVLSYKLIDSDKGKQLIEYEVQRYRIKNGLPPIDGTDAADLAAFAMENHPGYFGDFPAPIYTPRGRMLRYKVISPGVFAIEAENFEHLVAIAYPIWSCDLSDYVRDMGEVFEYDAERGEEITYHFYSEHSACLALFELCCEHEELASSPYISCPALMNAIWERFPEFAAARNIHEQKGDNDVGAHIMRLVGVDIEPEVNPENMVYLTPEAGTEYLRF